MQCMSMEHTAVLEAIWDPSSGSQNDKNGVLVQGF